ncbi:MAG: hypothetical protein WAO55_06910 [Candidatus Manganitrophaceae bacterium]
MQEQLEVLESRVREMIEVIKKLKREKEGLEMRIAEREREFQQLQEERGEARLRIERIMETLGHLQGHDRTENDSEVGVKVNVGEE